MTPYIILRWNSDSDASPALVSALLQDLQKDGWVVQYQGHRMKVFGPALRTLKIREMHSCRGIVVGDLFRREGSDAPSSIEGAVAAQSTLAGAAAQLLVDYWGRYVVVGEGRGQDASAIFRDPSGALEACVWRDLGVTVVASTLPSRLFSRVQLGLSINWNAVRAQLASPTEIGSALGISGIRAVSPGELLEVLSQSICATQLWTPGKIARMPVSSYEEGRANVRTAVDACIGAYARGGGRCLAEVSGGLDSSIVVSTLVRHSARLVSGVNYASLGASGDERAYAKGMAAHLDFPLEVKLKQAPNFAPLTIGEIQMGLRPCLVGLDDDYDRDIADECVAADAQTLFTGQGGDAIFFQAASPVVMVDRARRLGPLGIFSSELSRNARWTRQSGWSLLFGALRSGDDAGSPLPWGHCTWLRSAPGTDHPWLSDIDDLPPGKRFHIQSITSCLLNYGTSRRTHSADVIHPLLSQPIVEACLRIPADLLVRGGRDRALARDAFSDRLPSAIYKRRSKGELGALYGASIVDALDKIRPFLLEGRLRHHDLIIAKALAPILNEDVLAQDGGYIEILRAVALEAWVRHWEARLATIASLPRPVAQAGV